MPISVVSTPKRTSAFGSASYYVAAHSPLVYKFQRKDVIVLTITSNSGKVQLNLSSATPGDAKVGDSVYVDHVRYRGTHTIFSIGSNFIVLDTTYTNGTPATFANLVTARNQWAIELYIDNNVAGASTKKNIVIARYYADTTGLVVADIREYLLQELEFTTDAETYLGHNRAEGRMTVRYSLRYHEHYLNISVSPLPVDEGNTWYATKSALGLKSEFGSNMRNYQTQPGSVTQKAKWMTAFEKPTFFKGFPFALSFIYSDLNSANYIEKHIQELDINGSNSEPEWYFQLSHVMKGAVNRVTIRGKALQSDTDSLDFWLEEGGTITGGGGMGGGSGTGTSTVSGTIVDESGPGGGVPGYLTTTDYFTDQSD